MPKTPFSHLSRRERQIMDLLFKDGRATAADIQAALPDPPSYSAVRAMLRVLEDKGAVRHEQDGPRYMYRPTIARDAARRSAIDHLLHTFFDDSAGEAVAALLDESATAMSDAELDRLARLIDDVRKAGTRS